MLAITARLVSVPIDIFTFALGGDGGTTITEAIFVLMILAYSMRAMLVRTFPLNLL